MSTSTEVICCELQEEKDMAQDPVDIVVVDDNEVLLSVLTEILKECGCSVRTALDGLGALSEIRNRAPEVLLSDLNMPHMSGFELLSIVRRRYPRIKVVAMSGSYSGQCVPNGVAADAFYEKGATSVARLLQIDCGGVQERTRRALGARLNSDMDSEIVIRFREQIECVLRVSRMFEGVFLLD
jgi:CheY-like chemotaxis protein